MQKTRIPSLFISNPVCFNDKKYSLLRKNKHYKKSFAVCNRKSIDKAETKRSGIAAPFCFMIES